MPATLSFCTKAQLEASFLEWKTIEQHVEVPHAAMAQFGLLLHWETVDQYVEVSHANYKDFYSAIVCCLTSEECRIKMRDKVEKHKQELSEHQLRALCEEIDQSVFDSDHHMNREGQQIISELELVLMGPNHKFQVSPVHDEKLHEQVRDQATKLVDMAVSASASAKYRPGPCELCKLCPILGNFHFEKEKGESDKEDIEINDAPFPSLALPASGHASR